MRTMKCEKCGVTTEKAMCVSLATCFDRDCRGTMKPLTSKEAGGQTVPCTDGVRPACTWKYTADNFGEDIWETDCGESFVLIEGMPSDNKMKFCCYCGCSLIEKQV